MLKNVILQLLRLKNQQQPIDYREYGETGEPHKKGEFAGDMSTVGRVQIVSLSSCRNPAVLLSHPARAERILVAVCDGSVEDSKIIRSEQDV